MKPSITQKTAIISSLSALLLTACGDSDNSSSSTNATKTNTASTVQPTVVVENKDTTQPVLVLDTADVTSNQATYNLSGSVVDEGGLTDTTVTVTSKQSGQSQTATVDSSGNFTLSFPLQDGTNDLTVTVTDKAGNSESKTITVTQDTTAPVVTLDTEIENEVSRTTIFKVSGKVSDNQAISDITLTAGTTPVTINEDGTFTATIDLTAGENEIALTATDKAGNKAEQAGKVYQGFIMSAGAAHTGIIHNGKLYVWGQNNLGQVGIGKITKATDSDHPNTPTVITAPADTVSISFNTTHSSLLTKEGKVYTWGSNKDGQLGQSTNDIYQPTEVSGLPKIVMLSSGQRHHLTLAEDGSVYAFGYNSDGQLGSTIADKGNTSPVKVDFSSAENVGKIIQVSAGANASYALDDKGQVWAWGKNQFGNLGQGTTCESKNGCTDFNPTPVKVTGLDDINIVEISAGGDHVLALTDDGKVYGWGENRTSQIGFKSSTTKGTDKEWANNFPTPKLIPWSESNKAKHIFAKLTSSSLIGTDGNFYQWGVYGDNGAKTVNYYNLDEPSNETPILKNLYDIGIGNTHRIVKDKAGNILTVGWNFNGALGVADLQSSWMYNIPQTLTMPE